MLISYHLFAVLPMFCPWFCHFLFHVSPILQIVFWYFVSKSTKCLFTNYLLYNILQAPSPFLLPALCLLHPVHRKPEEPVAVHSTYDNMTTARRRVVQTIKPSLLQSSPQSLSPLLAAAFSRSRSCLSKRQNGVQRSCHQPNPDSERQQRSNILWSMNRVFKCINVHCTCMLYYQQTRRT